MTPTKGRAVDCGSYLCGHEHSSPPLGSPVALPHRSSYGSCRALLGNAHEHKNRANREKHTERGVKYILKCVLVLIAMFTHDSQLNRVGEGDEARRYGNRSDSKQRGSGSVVLSFYFFFCLIHEIGTEQSVKEALM